jgi:hypothetical protein
VGAGLGKGGGLENRERHKGKLAHSVLSPQACSSATMR